MKQELSKVCPACGTRNKAKWEFCVRCGESLQGVEATDAGAAAEKPAAIVGQDFEPAEKSSPLATIFALLLAVAAVAVVVVWAQRSQEPQAAVSSTAFQIPTLPPSLPAAVEVARGPADEDYDLGRRLLAQGDVAGAVQALGRAVEKLPGNAELRSLYAQALFQSGARDSALQQFEEAARLSPDIRFRLGYAAALNIAGKSNEAVEQYQQVLAQNPQEVQALKELGGLYNRMGRFEQAVTYLAQAAELNPGDLALQQDLAWSYESRNQLDQAAGIYQKVLTAAPQANLTRVRMAEVLLKQGKSAEALALVEEGVQRDASVPLLRRARASLFERAGRIAEAVAEYREYARIAPNADDARVMTERANRLEKQASGGALP